jgi:hypothetical protein
MSTPTAERPDEPAGVDAFVAALDPEVVASVARAALDVPTTQLEEWSVERITAGIGDATAGTFRVTGTARVGGETRRWSAVLKVIHPGWSHDAEARAARADADPGTWRNWQREALLYRSGVVAGVPGGFAPARCLRVDVEARRAFLWLEEVREDEPQPWPAARLRLAAQQLGRFQGAFAAGRPLPAEPWFPRDWLRQYVEACAPFVAWALANTFRGHPLADRLWPADVREGVLRVWEERAVLLDALDELPQTVRHGDANVGNLFARHDAAGAPETIAIDWELCAQGAVGEDLAGMLRARTRVRQELPPNALRDLVFGGYVDGLRDAGWRGDDDAVRLGHAAGAALRDCFHTMAFELIAEDRRDEAQARGGFTLERLADAMGSRVRGGLEHARRALELLGSR